MSRKTVSLILKGIVIVCAVTGTAISALAGRNTFMGGSRVFMFFTIQSNIAIALVCLIGAVLLIRKRIPARWFVVKFVFTVSITLTGVVFCFVLAPTLKGNAWNLQNILTHVVVPIAAVADFFVTGIASDIRKRSVLLVTIPPLLYAVYAGIGYVSGWEFIAGLNYQYFFLNWGSPAGAFGFTDGLPFMGCAWWIRAILILLIAVGLLYLKVLDLEKKQLQRNR
ncbi:MAG: Pr6Pr family membrane protein [Lachnospiraceae bacterium]|nr:Pr6Pr family membrane protein [Lachnospiraceae bacterium]